MTPYRNVTRFGRVCRLGPGLSFAAVERVLVRAGELIDLRGETVTDAEGHRWMQIHDPHGQRDGAWVAIGRVKPVMVIVEPFLLGEPVTADPTLTLAEGAIQFKATAALPSRVLRVVEVDYVGYVTVTLPVGTQYTVSGAIELETAYPPNEYGAKP